MGTLRLGWNSPNRRPSRLGRATFSHKQEEDAPGAHGAKDRMVKLERLHIQTFAGYISCAERQGVILFI